MDSEIRNIFRMVVSDPILKEAGLISLPTWLSLAWGSRMGSLEGLRLSIAWNSHKPDRSVSPGGLSLEYE